MRLNPKYIQLFGDAVIPLLGLFLWDWSLYFILLFYFLDMGANELVAHLKSKKIIQFHQQTDQKKKWIRLGILSAGALFAAIVMIHGALIWIVPGINFTHELVSFWNYEEMGVKQGYVLLPLVLLVSFQQYRITFLMSAKYRTTQIADVWRSHIQALLVILAFAGFSIAVSQFYSFSEMVYVLFIVGISTLYKLRFGK